MKQKLFLASFRIVIEPYGGDPIFGTKTQCRLIRAEDADAAREKLTFVIERRDTYVKDVIVFDLDISECIE